MKKNHVTEPILSEEELRFLRIVHDPARRGVLLEHLREQGLLDAFLQIESETN